MQDEQSRSIDIVKSVGGRDQRSDVAARLQAALHAARSSSTQLLLIRSSLSPTGSSRHPRQVCTKHPESSRWHPLSNLVLDLSPYWSRNQTPSYRGAGTVFTEPGNLENNHVFKPSFRPTLVVVPIIALLLAQLGEPSVGADQTDPEDKHRVSAEVVLHRKNTLGGWEIFASLEREGEDVRIRLRINDLGNFKAKVLQVEEIHFTIDGQSIDVACEQGVSVDRRERGIGILGDDTSQHVCPLGEDQVSTLSKASEIRSRVTVAGKSTKERQWKEKARARWAGFFR